MNPTSWLALLPTTKLFDAHTHVGENDPDGFRQSPQELEAVLRRAGATGAFFFPMHEPSGYREANDRVLAIAAQRNGQQPQLIPFCRVDPNADALAEATRCLDAGARGIKLHPRAENFTLDHSAVRELFALADRRRIPVLVHAGRGIPALGRHLVSLCAEFPGARAILAHAAITDLAWIWRAAAELPNLLFDSSWFMPADLRALFSLVPPGQILFASDAPYGDPATAHLAQLRIGAQVGMSEDQLRSVFAEQSLAIAAGQPLIPAGPAVGERERPPHVLLERVTQFLLIGTMMALRGNAPEIGAEQLALARQACEVPEGIDDAPIFDAVARLLDEYAADPATPEHREPFRRLVMALSVACTPDVPVPAA